MENRVYISIYVHKIQGYRVDGYGISKICHKYIYIWWIYELWDVCLVCMKITEITGLVLVVENWVRITEEEEEEEEECFKLQRCPWLFQIVFLYYP